jgi:hypothetical protein
MDRGRAALVLLLTFIACIGVAIVVSGSRPGPQQGIAPTVAAFVGYPFAFVAAVLLIAPRADASGGTRPLGRAVSCSRTPPPSGSSRRCGRWPPGKPCSPQP